MAGALSSLLLCGAACLARLFSSRRLIVRARCRPFQGAPNDDNWIMNEKFAPKQLSQQHQQQQQQYQQRCACMKCPPEGARCAASSASSCEFWRASRGSRETDRRQRPGKQLLSSADADAEWQRYQLSVHEGSHLFESTRGR